MVWLALKRGASDVPRWTRIWPLKGDWVWCSSLVIDVVPRGAVLLTSSEKLLQFPFGLFCQASLPPRLPWCKQLKWSSGIRVGELGRSGASLRASGDKCRACLYACALGRQSGLAGDFLGCCGRLLRLRDLQHLYRREPPRSKRYTWIYLASFRRGGSSFASACPRFSRQFADDGSPELSP